MQIYVYILTFTASKKLEKFIDGFYIHFDYLNTFLDFFELIWVMFVFYSVI